MKKKKPVNYIDNKTFYLRLVEYQKECYESVKEERERPIIPNDIAICIQTIATRLATKPNYSGYIFKEDMIGDGVENALEAVLKFDPAKSENPFAYFTQIIWNAFLRKIEKEKKLLLIKKKYYDHKYVNQELVDYSLSDKTKIPYVDTYVQNDYMDELEKKHDEKNG